MAQRRNSDYQSRNSGMRGRGSASGHNTRAYSNRLNTGAQQSTSYEQRTYKTIYVPSNMVGMIIGRRGAKISELQSQSEATIKVIQSENDQTEVVLCGTNNAIVKAELLITNLIIEITTDSTQNSFTCEFSEELNATHEQKLKEKWAKLPPIAKNCYNEHAEISMMSANDVAYWRIINNDIQVSRISTDGSLQPPIPNPVLTFEHAFHNVEQILNIIDTQDIIQPSPIQSQAWPILLRGEDMIGIAQSDSGQTLAYILPAIIHLNKQVPRSKRKGPCVLILALTRELILEIENEIKKYNFQNAKTVCLYGKSTFNKKQMNTIESGVDIVIATPYRLHDVIQARNLDMTNFSYIALDEADKMLESGYIYLLHKPLLDLRPERQIVMTLCTWPTYIENIANTYLKNPILVNIDSDNIPAGPSVSHEIKFVDEENEKYELLAYFLRQVEFPNKALVFCANKTTAAEISCGLAIRELNNRPFHGNMYREDRQAALQAMHDGTVNILVVTDVASKQLDITDITHTVNIDFPTTIKEYIYRVARTGTARSSGKSLSFMRNDDQANAESLIDILKQTDEKIPEKLIVLAEKYKLMKKTKNERGKRGKRRR